MTRISRTLLAALFAAALAAPASAQAATVSVSGGKASFTAASGEANRLTVRNGYGGTLEFEDTGVLSITAGVGCSVVSAQRVRCLPGTGFAGVVVDAGDGNDTIDDDLFVTAFTTYGGLGNDTVRGGGGPDSIDGGAGTDTLSGAGGDDVFVASDGADAMNGEAGRDSLSYAARTAAVSVSPDGVANDGAAGEGDNVSAIEDLTGGAGADTLVGTDAANQLTGGGGDDSLTSAGGDDLLDGGAGNDAYDAGAGVDVLKTRDATQESLTCGSDDDVADADYHDNAAADCEVVNRDEAPPVPPVPPPPVAPPVVDPVIPPAPTGGVGNVIEAPVATIPAAPVPVSASGVATVSLSCPSEAFEGCAGTILMEALDAAGSSKGKLDVRGARRRPTKKTKLANRRFKVAAGVDAKIPVRLERRAWRKFKKRKRVKVQITVTMQNATGTTTSTRTVTLKPQPPRRKGSR